MTATTTRIYNRQKVSVDTDINLLGPIGGPEDYMEDFQVLREAAEGETVHLYINTPGGRVDTAIQYVNEIRACKGEVIGHLMSCCHSAGSYIFINCDGWVVHENSLMLIHNYSGGSEGKGLDIVLNVNETHEWITETMGNYYRGFLTEEEIDKCCKNKDYYFHTDEIISRLERLQDMREKEESDLEEALKEEIKAKALELSSQ